MSYQKRAFETLSTSGGLKGMSAADKTMALAAIEDTEMLYEGQKEMKTRMDKIEKDVESIKHTVNHELVRKSDLTDFKDALIPAIQKAAQFDLVQKTANWKVVLAVIIVFFVAVIIAGFGLRGLEILAPIGERAVG